MLKSWRFLTVVLVSLALGISFAHLLAMPMKLGVDWPLYALSLAAESGAATLGRYFELGGFVALLSLTIATRNRHPNFVLSLTGTIFSAAAIAIWFVLLAPIAMEWEMSTLSFPPLQWGEMRARWEFLQAIRAFFLFGSFTTALLSVTTESRALTSRREEMPIAATGAIHPLRKSA